MSSTPCAHIRRFLQLFGSNYISRLYRRWSSRVVRPGPPRTSEWVDLGTDLLVFGYSPRHFAYLHPRIEAHLRERFIPPNEHVFAYLRVNMVMNDSSKTNPKSPGLIIFTAEKLYILKILDEEYGDLHKWLEEEFANFPLEKVQSMRAVCFNQGILITCKDQSKESTSLSEGQVSYLLLLHERKRTLNFLSFMKKSGILPSERINGTRNPEVPILPQLGEEIEYFLVSEVIVVFQNHEEWQRFTMPGFAFSKNKLVILRYTEVDDNDKTSDKYETELIIEHERKIADVTRGYDKKALLVLQFKDKETSMTEVWYIKIGLAMTHRVIAELNDIWRCYK